MSKKKAAYLNPALAADARVKDLLKRMTLEEKAGQLISACPVNQLRMPDYNDRQVIVKGKQMIDAGIGQLGVAVRHATPETGPKIANELHRYALEETRLGIPILIQEECVHGCKANGSTMFPMSIGLAASWDTALMERVVHAIGKETRARGINQCLSPTLNIARDVRCGRVEETYGEDPYLVARMGVAFIKTLQQYGIAATPKHFVANFVGDGGRDSHAVHFSERLLREIYFPAFKAAIQEAGTMSLMVAHTAIDGIPCSANSWLMNDVVRKEWGFKGFIVPDNTDVQKNHYIHFMAPSWDESSRMCIEAGLDTDLSWPPPDPRLCYRDALPRLVREGVMAARVLDDSCGRVLRVKFQLGLFEDPYVDPEPAATITQCEEHRALAREAAVRSMVLLKNERLLPLSKRIKKLAVIGPSAYHTRLGGYTCANAAAISPLEGIQAKLGETVRIRDARGCGLCDDDTSGFAEAVRLARWADAVVLCMGNSSDKIIGQPETTEGERHDRCDLDLPGVQEELIERVVAANPDVVVVLQNGSAITMRRWVGKVKAILDAWYPGAEGGNAIADVLFGDCNPAGRLPLTFPITTGQCPLYYNPRPHGRVADYCDLRGPQAQFAFGHGLSYTRFKYDRLTVRNRRVGGEVEVSVRFDVKNTGRRKGDEVVQLYLRDVFSTITRPIMELRRFERITLKAGETRRVTFMLGTEDFSYLDAKMTPVLEPGDFDIMIGASSDDIRLRKTIEL